LRPVAWRLVGLALVILVVVPVAIAQDEDRVVIGKPGFPAATVVTVPVLAEFRRTAFDGDAGSWAGPTCERPPLNSGTVSVTWRVVVSTRRSAAEAARAAMTFRWSIVESGTTLVRHFVAGRDVGAIPGTFVVTDSQSSLGWHEAGLGFPIGRGLYVGAEAWSRGNASPCIVRSVQGPIPVATWHRQTSARAVQGIRLQGNLPPARVTARGFARRVAGTVRDSFGHPVAAATIVLQRRAGSGWRRVSSGRTTRTGAYAMRARRRGQYRAVAALAGASARSSVVRAGR
jgi:hypothetical protein